MYFLHSLFNILNDPLYHPFIQWSDEGKTFSILDRERFLNFVLIPVFNYRNYNQFTKNLLNHNFFKIIDSQKYYNKNFNKYNSNFNKILLKKKNNLTFFFFKPMKAKGSEFYKKFKFGFKKYIHHLILEYSKYSIGFL